MGRAAWREAIGTKAAWVESVELLPVVTTGGLARAARGEPHGETGVAARGAKGQPR